MSVVRNLMVRIGADFSALTKAMNRTQQSISDFQVKVAGMASKVNTALAAVGIGMAAKDMVMDAVKVEAAVGSIGRTLGTNAGQFEQWAKTSAAGFGMSEQSALQYGRTYSMLLSGFTKNTGETTKYTQDLLKATAVSASNMGMSMDEALERVRSGLLGNTEAIEDLGLNVNVAMLTSTDAFKKFAGDKSWDQLDFKTQQTIRYFGILEQANTKFGTSMANNTATKLMVLNAQLQNTKLYLSQAFLPLLQIVIPALTAFSKAASQAMQGIDGFVRAMFGMQLQTESIKQADQSTVIDDTADSFDGLTDSIQNTTNAQKSLLAGIDKVNILQTATKDTGLAGTASTAKKTATQNKEVVKPVIPIGMSSEMTKWEKIGQKFRATMAKMFNNPTFQKYYQLFKGAIESIWGTLKDFGVDLYKFFTTGPGKKFGEALQNMFEFLYPIVKFLVDVIVEDIKTLFSGIGDVIKGAIEIFTGIFTGDWGLIWDGIIDSFRGKIKVIWIIVQYFFGAKLLGVVAKFAGRIAKWGAKLWDWFKQPFAKLGRWFVDKMSALGNISFDFMKKVGGKIWDAIKSGTGSVADWITGILTKTKDLGKQAIDSAANIGLKIWDAIKSGAGSVGTWITEKLAAFKELAKKAIDGAKTIGLKIWDAVKTGASSIGEWITEKLVAFKDLGKKAVEVAKNIGLIIWGIIKQGSGTVGEWITEKLTAFKNLGKKALESSKLIGLAIWDAIQLGAGTISDWIAEKLNSAKNLGKNVIDAAKSLGGDIWDTLKEGFGSADDWFKGMINKMISSVNVLIEKMNEALSFTVPKWIPSIGGKVWSVGMPTIPYLAKGGVVNSATLAMIGEAGKEVVMPLENNTGWINDLASKLNSGMGSGEIVINLGGHEIGRVTQKQLNIMSRQAGRTVLNI
jgi:hypothetical protein